MGLVDPFQTKESEPTTKGNEEKTDKAGLFVAIASIIISIPALVGS